MTESQDSIISFTFSMADISGIHQEQTHKMRLPVVTVMKDGCEPMSFTLESLPPEIFSGSLKTQAEAQAITQYLTSNPRSPWVERNGVDNESQIYVYKPSYELKKAELVHDKALEMDISRDLHIQTNIIAHDGLGDDGVRSIGYSAHQYLKDEPHIIGFNQQIVASQLMGDFRDKEIQEAFVQFNKDPSRIIKKLMQSSMEMYDYMATKVSISGLSSNLIIGNKTISNELIEKAIDDYWNDIDPDSLQFESVEPDSEPGIKKSKPSRVGI